MTPRTGVAALLIAFAAVPASADFCYWKDGRSDDGTFRELDRPACTQDNTFKFLRASPPHPESWSRDGSTTVSDSMPGWMGADEKCRKAVAGAKVISFRTETYLVAWALSGARIFKFKTQCSTVKYKFMAKYAELQRDNPKEAENPELALKAAGGEEISKNELIERLIEVADAEAAKEAAKRAKGN